MALSEGPVIKVIGVGGGGGNAVNRMMAADVHNADFIVANTDIQALNMSTAPYKIQLGREITKGLGAGSDPEVGKKAAEESTDEINSYLEGTDLLFIAAGMGGGTGTGAAPVIAQLAKAKDILTVAVVTKPFESFEGSFRINNANKGIDELRKYVDTLIIVPNERILQCVPKGTMLKKAFQIADEILMQGVVGVSGIISQESVINLDFADIRTTMRNKGNAHIGIGRGKGENKTLVAVQQAVNSPLLETNIQGATNLILFASASEDITIDEVHDSVSLVREVLDPGANIIFGMGYNKDFSDEVMITVVATGFDSKNKASNGYAYGSTLFEDQTKKDERMLNVYGYSSKEEAREQNIFRFNEQHTPSMDAGARLFSANVDKPTSDIPAPGIDQNDDNDLPPFLRKMRGK